MAKRIEMMTTTGADPVADKQDTITAGPNGSLRMQDYQMPEKLAHQILAGFSERTAHSKAVRR